MATSPCKQISLPVYHQTFNKVKMYGASETFCETSTRNLTSTGLKNKPITSSHDPRPRRMLKRGRVFRDNKAIKKRYNGTTFKGHEDEDSGYESNDLNADDFALNTNSRPYDCGEWVGDRSYYGEKYLLNSDFIQKDFDLFEENQSSEKVIFSTFFYSEEVEKENADQCREENSNINNQTTQSVKQSPLYQHQRRKHFPNIRRNFFRFIETTNKRNQRSLETKGGSRSRSPLGHAENMET